MCIHHTCDMTHSYVRHKSYRCVSRLIHTCDMTHSFMSQGHTTYSIGHSCTRLTWLIHTCDMTHSYVRHDSCVCAIWHIHMCDMTHSFMSQGASDLLDRALLHMRNVTHSFMSPWHLTSSAEVQTQTPTLTQQGVTWLTHPYWRDRMSYDLL